MKNPHHQLSEALFEINRTAYQTDDTFKDFEAEMEEALIFRDKFADRIQHASPAKQIKMQVQLNDLDQKIENGRRSLEVYLKEYFEKDGKIELESPDQAKLDAAFAEAKAAGERIYLIYKYTRPHLLEGFMKVVSEKAFPEEIEEYLKNVARREKYELDEILASVSDDKLTIRP